MTARAQHLEQMITRLVAVLQSIGTRETVPASWDWEALCAQAVALRNGDPEWRKAHLESKARWTAERTSKTSKREVVQAKPNHESPAWLEYLAQLEARASVDLDLEGSVHTCGPACVARNHGRHDWKPVPDKPRSSRCSRCGASWFGRNVNRRDCPGTPIAEIEKRTRARRSR